MQIQQLMTRKLVTVTMDDPLLVVKEIFDHVPFHHLLVLGDDDSLVGVISDRDLFKALSPNLGTAAETKKDTASLHKKAHQIMSRKPITQTASADIYSAIDLFLSNKISCLPIVDEDHKPVGILSWRDILQALAERRKPAKTD